MSIFLVGGLVFLSLAVTCWWGAIAVLFKYTTMWKLTLSSYFIAEGFACFAFSYLLLREVYDYYRGKCLTDRKS
jgi:hypothetical protein